MRTNKKFVTFHNHSKHMPLDSNGHFIAFNLEDKFLMTTPNKVSYISLEWQKQKEEPQTIHNKWFIEIPTMKSNYSSSKIRKKTQNFEKLRERERMPLGEEDPLIKPREGTYQPMLGLKGTFKWLGDPHHPPPFNSIHSHFQ